MAFPQRLQVLSYFSLFVQKCRVFYEDSHFYVTTNKVQQNKNKTGNLRLRKTSFTERVEERPISKVGVAERTVSGRAETHRRTQRSV